uniref:Uncharacterized protein n=1 Tax=Aegilops tauschii TaxID=37682 RepID=M8BIU6_AEGTA
MARQSAAAHKVRPAWPVKQHGNPPPTSSSPPPCSIHPSAMQAAVALSQSQASLLVRRLPRPYYYAYVSSTRFLSPQFHGSIFAFLTPASACGRWRNSAAAGRSRMMVCCC